MTQEKKKTIIKLVVSAIILAAVLLCFFLVYHHFGLDDMSEDELYNKIKEIGVIMPLIYIIVCFLQVTFIPIPGLIVIPVGKMLFKPFWGFVYTFIGMTAGGMFAFFLGKVIGRPFADWLAGGKGKSNEWLTKLKGKENVLLFFMFLFPLFPDDLLCTVAGLLPMSYLSFFALQAFTRATSIIGTMIFWTEWVMPLPIRMPLMVVGTIFGLIAFVFAFAYAEKIDNFIKKIFRKVYYGEKYFSKKKEGKIAGIETFIGKKVVLDGRPWQIAAIYKTPQGYVVDMYSQGAKKKVKPKINFSVSLFVDDREIKSEYKYGIVYYNKKTKKDYKWKKEARAYMKHYKRDMKYSNEFVRFCFPSVTATPYKKIEMEFVTVSEQCVRIALNSKKKNNLDDVIDFVKG